MDTSSSDFSNSRVLTKAEDMHFGSNTQDLSPGCFGKERPPNLPAPAQAPPSLAATSHSLKNFSGE